MSVAVIRLFVRYVTGRCVQLDLTVCDIRSIQQLNSRGLKLMRSYSRAFLKPTDFWQSHGLPLLRDHSHLGLLVAYFQFHTNPIFLRCSLTRAAMVSISLTRLG